MLPALASGGMLFLLDRWSKKAVQLRVAGGFPSCGPFLRIRYVIHIRPRFTNERMPGLHCCCFGLLRSCVPLSFVIPARGFTVRLPKSVSVWRSAGRLETF